MVIRFSLVSSLRIFKINNVVPSKERCFKIFNVIKNIKEVKFLVRKKYNKKIERTTNYYVKKNIETQPKYKDSTIYIFDKEKCLGCEEKELTKMYRSKIDPDVFIKM